MGRSGSSIFSSSSSRQSKSGIIPLKLLKDNIQATTGTDTTNRGREHTLYVPGFISGSIAGEEQAYKDWLTSHEQLRSKPGYEWGSDVSGWNWPSGNMPVQMSTGFIPFLSLARGAMTYMARSAGAFRPLNPLRVLTPRFMATSAAQEMTFMLGNLLWEFRRGSLNAKDRAAEFAEALRKLRQENDYVRIVGHSLGCKHVVEGIALLDPKERPNEVHMVAPTFNEQFIAKHLQTPLTTKARRPSSTAAAMLSDSALDGGTWFYYSDRDLILLIFFKYLSPLMVNAGNRSFIPDFNAMISEIAVGGSGAVGSYGLAHPENYPGIVNNVLIPYSAVSDVNPFLLHVRYGSIFHRFAVSTTTEQQKHQQQQQQQQQPASRQEIVSRMVASMASVSPTFNPAVVTCSELSRSQQYSGAMKEVPAQYADWQPKPKLYSVMDEDKSNSPLKESIDLEHPIVDETLFVIPTQGGDFFLYDDFTQLLSNSAVDSSLKNEIVIRS